jgi:hypothetical protein
MPAAPPVTIAVLFSKLCIEVRGSILGSKAEFLSRQFARGLNSQLCGDGQGGHLIFEPTEVRLASLVRNSAVGGAGCKPLEGNRRFTIFIFRYAMLNLTLAGMNCALSIVHSNAVSKWLAFAESHNYLA